MATYFVNSGAGGANTGGSWTDAYLTYAQAVTAATAVGDIIKVHKTHTEELGSDTTYTLSDGVSTYCVDKDASDALATMGVAAWIGNSTTNRSVTVDGPASGRYTIKGITFRTAGSTVDFIGIGGSTDTYAHLEDCYLWQGNTGGNLRLGASTTNIAVHVALRNCTLRFGATTSSIAVNGHVEITGGSLSSAGSAPTNLFSTGNATAGGVLEATGFDLSHAGSGNIIGSITNEGLSVTLKQCKLGTGFVGINATQQTYSTNLFIYDCDDGDQHYHFQHHNPLGSTIVDAGIYATSGQTIHGTGGSFKVVTTADALFGNPYIGPWIALYNSTLSAITPSFEILHNINNWAASTVYGVGTRVINDTGKVYVCDQAGTSAGSGGPTGTGTDIADNTARWDYVGTSTAYQDDEVWGEWSYKGTSGSTQATVVSDRMTPLGTPANQATGALGAGDWTGENATSWFGKLAPSAITPAEVGHIMGRVVVGEPSVTLYVDPQVRVA